MIANDDLGNLGRLGNQMFQYTSLRGLAARHGYDYCLPPREIVGTRDINCANSDITMFECFKIPDAPRMITNFPRIMEMGFELDQNLWNSCPDNISLFGYFQTEKYFKQIESEIRKAFTFVEAIKEPCEQAFKNGFGDNKVISMHFRRGDYLMNPNHVVQTMEYYLQALSFFDNSLPVMIFSDDVEWCKLQPEFQDDRFNFSENNGTGFDLCLQSLCNYHIIANSSYSWWGSWLAKSEGTVAPRKWFGECLDKNTKDLYLDGWLVL